jgi:hypothetical protein
MSLNDKKMENKCVWGCGFVSGLAKARHDELILWNIEERNHLLQTKMA